MLLELRGSKSYTYLLHWAKLNSDSYTKSGGVGFLGTSGKS